jgi:hypothetical protein
MNLCSARRFVFIFITKDGINRAATQNTDDTRVFVPLENKQSAHAQASETFGWFTVLIDIRVL